MCGIFGFSGKHNAREFNVLKFSVLGTINDSRGGDSSGAFIDGECDYGINNEKLFSKFVINNKFVTSYENRPVQIALGHCRKASVGNKTIKEAQPVCIPNDDGTKTDFVMIHNGTLLNHEELKNKYLTKVPAYFTDSQIFANILYFYGPDKLSEYNGAGAFVFVDYRQKEPITYIFRGESPIYKNGTTSTGERPLFWMKTKEGIWFSSIKESLELISLGHIPVTEVPANTLHVIQNGKIIGTKIIDRSNKYQLEYSYGSYGYGGYGYSSGKTVSNACAWDCDNYGDWYGPKYSSEKSFSANSLKDGYSEDVYDYAASSKVIFKPDGRYYKGQQVLNGMIKISEYGYSNAYSTVNTTSVAKPKPFYFFEGFLMKNALCMYIARKIKETLGEKFEYQMLRSLTMTCFYDPATQLFYTKKGKLYKGQYPVYFSLKNSVYTIEKGKVVLCTNKYSTTTCSTWKLYRPQFIDNCFESKWENLIKTSANKIIEKFKK